MHNEEVVSHVGSEYLKSALALRCLILSACYSFHMHVEHIEKSLKADLPERVGVGADGTSQRDRRKLK